LPVFRCPGRAGAAIIRPHIESSSGNHLKKSGKPDTKGPRIIPRAAHNVSRDDVSKSALKVLYRLNKSGYQAFLVGGCVRDALVGLHPKDFDVATNATPEEVRALFGNCRLIGRRFRLAHVRFGREIIEVATFRAAANHVDDDVSHDQEGRILRDNVYGSIEEDVWRRDFTCNALYYNIADFSIWDYTDGFEHVKEKKIVLIGSVEQRLREDPVRMLRAIRFAAKLDFAIDKKILDDMHEHVDRIANVPAARLFNRSSTSFRPVSRRGVPKRHSTCCVNTACSHSCFLPPTGNSTKTRLLPISCEQLCAIQTAELTMASRSHQCSCWAYSSGRPPNGWPRFDVRKRRCLSRRH